MNMSTVRDYCSTLTYLKIPDGFSSIYYRVDPVRLCQSVNLVDYKIDYVFATARSAKGDITNLRNFIYAMTDINRYHLMLRESEVSNEELMMTDGLARMMVSYYNSGIVCKIPSTRVQGYRVKCAVYLSPRVVDINNADQAYLIEAFKYSDEQYIRWDKTLAGVSYK